MDFQTIQLVTTVILVLTLFVAAWQTFLTRQAVAGQKKNFELEASPWLKGMGLKPQPVEDDPSQLEAWLVIKNVGKTPAIAVAIKSHWKTLEEGKVAEHGAGDHHGISIPPDDVCNVQLCRMQYGNFPHMAEIDTAITYSTIFGGKGEIGLSFIQRADTDWVNGPTTYKFIASDGKEYGEPPRLLKLGHTTIIPKGSIQEE